MQEVSQNRGGAGRSFGILFLLLLIVAGVFLFFVLNNMLVSEKERLIKAIKDLKEGFVFAKLQLHDNGAESVDFTLTLLTPAGETVLQRRQKMTGKDVFLESRVIVVSVDNIEKAFVFPYRLYTDEIAPKDGEDIRGFYVSNGFPQIYKTTPHNPDLSKTVMQLYATAFQIDNPQIGQFDKNYFKVELSMDAVLHPKYIKSYKNGKTYRCVLHPNGGLELTEGQ